MVDDADLRIWFDVDAFEQEVALGIDGPLPCSPDREAALRRALELYQGDLLAGRYDDWCLAERERLRLLLLRVLKRLQRHSRLVHDFEASAAHGKRLLRLDSLQEDVHREMMRCYADSGRPTRALEHFHRWREELRSELAVEPMQETWDLYYRIRAERTQSPLASDAPAPLASLESALVAFDRALVALCNAQEALQAAAAECGVTVEIGGRRSKPLKVE
jgi:DNA-binding SARP family transcriptional activator